jgi:hypothetical protein
MFLEDLISLLEAANLGKFGVDIFKGAKSAPPTGDGPYFTLARTGGRGEEGTHNTSRDGIAYERPFAQIVCRAKDANVAEQNIVAAYGVMSFVDKFINGTWWRSCSPRQEPFELGLDEAERVRFAFNVECVKRP